MFPASIDLVFDSLLGVGPLGLDLPWSGISLAPVRPSLDLPNVAHSSILVASCWFRLVLTTSWNLFCRRLNEIAAGQGSFRFF